MLVKDLNNISSNQEQWVTSSVFPIRMLVAIWVILWFTFFKNSAQICFYCDSVSHNVMSYQMASFNNAEYYGLNAQNQTPILNGIKYCYSSAGN